MGGDTTRKHGRGIVRRVHVSRLGLAALKGTRHVDLGALEVAAAGPVGDRVFALVDRAVGRVLRTVEHPSLMTVTARWDGRTLTLDLPAGTVEGEPRSTGERLEVDYWGRRALLDVVDGPWSEACSEHLGRAVTLTRSTYPGDVVYGAAVSLVTTSSLDALSHDLGVRVDGAMFRATATVDTTGLPAYAEDEWVGHRVRLGGVEVEVRGAVPRCAVVGLDPGTGRRRADVLGALASRRRPDGEIVFGVDAVVTAPGRVQVGAEALLSAAGRTGAVRTGVRAGRS